MGHDNGRGLAVDGIGLLISVNPTHVNIQAAVPQHSVLYFMSPGAELTKFDNHTRTNMAVLKASLLIKIALVTFASQLALGFENAYDLAERMHRHRSEARSQQPQQGYFNKLRVHERFNPAPMSRQRYSDARATFVPRWSQNVMAGNGYDNLGNNARLGQRDWHRYLEPTKPDDYRFSSSDGGEWDRIGERSWDSTRDSYNVRAVDPIHPFRRGSGEYFRKINVQSGHPSDPFPNNFYTWSGSEVDPFRGEPFERRADTEIHRRTGGGGGVAFNRKTDLHNPNLGLARHPTRTYKKRRPLPSFLTLSRRPTPRISPLTSDRAHNPIFYQKNYFRRNDAPAGVGEATIEASNADEDFQTTAGGADDSGFEKTDSYVSSNEGQEEQKRDMGYLDNTEATVSDVANQEQVGETSHFDKNSGNKSTIHVNRLSKKGHTTKGFATHHHKDETGNSTTFFDESSDSGGQEDYQDHEDGFGARRTMEVLNGREDGRLFKENGGRVGKFGSGSLLDKAKVEKEAFAKNNRYNKEESFGNGSDHVDRGFKAETDYLGGGLWAPS